MGEVYFPLMLKPKITDEYGEGYYLFHTLTGYHPTEHFALYRKHSRKSTVDLPGYKMWNFLSGEATLLELEERLGLPFREVMCTIASIRNAVAYHLPYGLVLDGTIHTCFDNDSGLHLNSKTGRYEGAPFDFTNEVTLDHLIEQYRHKYRKEVSYFTWDEVILHPGSHIIGAFFDPRSSRTQSSHYTQPHERECFIEKCRTLGLPILEIDAKWK